MSVTPAYLTKIRRGVRINQDDDFDAELTDIIEECRQDLISVGVTETAANDEDDQYILGAVRSFARWKFIGRDDHPYRVDYMIQRDELRRKTGYGTSLYQ